MTALTRILLGLAATLSLASCAAPRSLPVGDPSAGDGPTTTTAAPAADAAPTTTATAATATTTTRAAARVEAAGTSASLGFNNAEQMVRTADGVLHAVWVDGDTLVHGAIDPSGAVTTSRVRRAGAIILPAIAASGTTLAVAWTEGASDVTVATSPDGGASWSSPTPLGGGTGASLAGDDRGFVAVWHDGHEHASSSIRLARLDAGATGWSDPRRVDTSPAAPVWPSVAVDGDDVWVAWRDDRDGPYTVWLRRSTDRAGTWLAEQQVVAGVSGDPDVCTAGGSVWAGYHAAGSVEVVRLAGGSVSTPPVTVGPGWFAHVSCGADGGVGVAWEQTTGPLDDDAAKAAAYALVGADGHVTTNGVTQEHDAIAASILLGAGGTADVLWIDGTTTDVPLRGALWHQVVSAG